MDRAALGRARELADARFDLAVVGEAPAGVLGEDHLAVDDDVEHPVRSANELRLNAELPLQ